MAERDEFDEQAEQLLPCLFDPSGTTCCVEENLCYACAHVGIVASALRESAKREAELHEERDEARLMLSLCNSTDYARAAEVVDLRREVEGWQRECRLAEATVYEKDDEIAALKAKLEHIERRDDKS